MAATVQAAALAIVDLQTAAEYVKLISSDEFEFIIDRKCAMASGTIKNMLSSPGKMEAC